MREQNATTPSRVQPNFLFFPRLFFIAGTHTHTELLALVGLHVDLFSVVQDYVHVLVKSLSKEQKEEQNES